MLPTGNFDLKTQWWSLRDCFWRQVSSLPGDLTGDLGDAQSAAAAVAAALVQHSQNSLYPPDQAVYPSRAPEASASHPHSGDRRSSSRMHSSCNSAHSQTLQPCRSIAQEASELRQIGLERAGEELDGQEAAPLGLLDALRMASALEDFLRMLGLHEQLHVIPSSQLLGACKGPQAASREAVDSDDACIEPAATGAISPARQLHMQRVLPSGRNVALSVS